jgi:predicted nucleotidyltransferase
MKPYETIDIQKKLDELKSVVLTIIPETVVIFLFGSYVNRFPNEDSDLDVCILVHDDTVQEIPCLVDIINIRIRNIRPSIHLQIEKLADFNRRAQLPTIAKEIMNEGVCIYGSFVLDRCENITELHREFIWQQFKHADGNFCDILRAYYNFKDYFVCFLAYLASLDFLHIYIMHKTKQKPVNSQAFIPQFEQCLTLDTGFVELSSSCKYLAKYAESIQPQDLKITYHQIFQAVKCANNIRAFQPIFTIRDEVGYSYKVKDYSLIAKFELENK